MHRIKNLLRVIFKIQAGLIYLSFFLVQFNIHLSGTPREISVFTCDYSPTNCAHHDFSAKTGGIHKRTRHSGFKLNKRFHPENLFMAPAQSLVLVEIRYRTPEPLLNDEQPLTNYSFNAPSFRGPPVIV
jgi:hypothetical protein